MIFGICMPQRFSAFKNYLGRFINIRSVADDGSVVQYDGDRNKEASSLDELKQSNEKLLYFDTQKE